MAWRGGRGRERQQQLVGRSVLTVVDSNTRLSAVGKTRILGGDPEQLISTPHVRLKFS